MRVALALMTIIGLATVEPAAAATTGAPMSGDRVQAQAGMIKASHRRWHIVPTSPYYSAGYPRLYYYPWGLGPHARWQRWRHR